MNASDDPTRDVRVREPVSRQICSGLSISDLQLVAQSKGLRRWAANWVRLMCLLIGKEVFSFGDKSVFRRPFSALVPAKRPGLEHVLDFDQTLGYPGEGPFALLFLCCFPHLFSSIGPGNAVHSWTFAAIFLVKAMATPLQPRNPGDLSRAKIRAQRGPLPQGRPVLGTTEKQRTKLLEEFRVWLSSKGVQASDLFANAYHNIEEINTFLSMYGRDLYKTGRPLAHYSETINALGSWKPQLRRTLQGAWDVAYAWVKTEPAVHHTAMPPQVLLAVITCCLTWGWVRAAGCFALAWGGLLRAGELLQACRQDLQLPSDLGGTTPFLLLSIPEPKTRFSTARHQASKVDLPDLIDVCELAFSTLKPSEKLWDMSPQTLRSRFKAVCGALSLPTGFLDGMRPLDLASLRPGGATYLLQTTESGDLVQRRGRWASYRIMSIYIQEVASVSFLARLEKSRRENILAVAACFVHTLKLAKSFKNASVPTAVWYLLFSSHRKEACK